jgi:hypothetical protein
MDIILDDTEVRILGCLIEKEMTTPEYYPLSLNSLTNACNQKTNRNPVVSYDQAVVEEGVESLQYKGLAIKTHTTGSRVTKYLHAVLDKFDLSRQELAILCEFMLRGPQTVGEIRTHAERMSPSENLEEVEEALQRLMNYDPPLAVKLPRETGRKECRHTHLFSGSVAHDFRPEPVASPVTAQQRITILEEEIAKIRNELEELKQALSEFKSQF